MRLPLFALMCLNLCAADPALLVRAARMLDVRSGHWVTPAQVLVVDGRISAGPVPAGVQVLDLGDRTLLPGLIDCHTHLCFKAGLSELESLKQSDAAAVIAGVVNARKVLQAGFTTVRNLGGPANFGDLDLRDAIDRGEIEGPTLRVAGPALSITGGHGDTTGYPAGLLQPASNLVDSPEAGIKAVREWRKRGVDLIKIHATGGVMSNRDDPGAPSFTPAEFQAIVDEARRRGMDVAAHAHGDQGILEATLAGVRSIEHGSLLSPATAAQMKAHGTFLVPTLFALECIALPGNPLHLAEGSLAKAHAILPLRRAAFKAALDAGVAIAYGTDIGVFDHAQVAMDFRYLVSYGMTPLQAIQTATVTAARLLRLEDRIGTLEPGKDADLVAVDGNPLERIETLEHVAFVMRHGKVVKGI
jgi:imidazolonepropionase-like amidohydrolase